MLVTTDIYKKVFDYIDPWGEIISSIEWATRESCHHSIQDTPGQAIFGRNIILNLTSVVDSRIITDGKHRQVDIDNFQ